MGLVSVRKNPYSEPLFKFRPTSSRPQECRSEQPLRDLIKLVILQFSLQFLQHDAMSGITW